MLSGFEPKSESENLAEEKISKKISSEQDDLDSNAKLDVITSFSCARACPK